MNRTTVKVSAPPEKLELFKELASDYAFAWIDRIKNTIEFTFEFPDNPDYLLEQTMGCFDIVKLDEDPRFEGCEIESVNEYPEVK